MPIQIRPWQAKKFSYDIPEKGNADLRIYEKKTGEHLMTIPADIEETGDKKSPYRAHMNLSKEDAQDLHDKFWEDAMECDFCVNDEMVDREELTISKNGHQKDTKED